MFRYCRQAIVRFDEIVAMSCLFGLSLDNQLTMIPGILTMPAPKKLWHQTDLTRKHANGDLDEVAACQASPQSAR